MIDFDHLWAETLGEEVAQREIDTGVKHEDWIITGRASKEFPNKEDLSWWDAKGPEMLQGYADWRKATGWEIWTAPDGRPGIELPFSVDWLPGLPLKGYIDRIFIHPFTGTLIVCDIKSGSRTPDKRQLAEYACAVEIEYGVRPEFGMYFMTRTKKADLVTLDEPSHQIDYLINESAMKQAGIEAGAFHTVIGNLCGTCTVKDFCPEFAEQE